MARVPIYNTERVNKITKVCVQYKKDITKGK